MMAEQMLLPSGEGAKSCVAGVRFGQLTVLEDAPRQRGSRVRVRCNCGVEKTVARDNLLFGKTRSCGCSRINGQGNPGSRFGRLVIIGDAPKGPHGKRRVCVRCECGTTKVMYLASVLRPSTISCGCHNRRQHTIHGLSQHPLYAVWSTMRARCSNPNHDSFEHYGGRGIRVCERWGRSFEAFYADMGPTWRPRLTLDRIDNDANYEPGNCHWATPKVQALNTRRTRWLETPWGRLTIREAAERSGLNYFTLRSRLGRGIELFHYGRKRVFRLPR